MTPDRGEKYCPSCGELVSEEAATCAHCGSALDGSGGDGRVTGGTSAGSSSHQSSLFEFALRYPFSNGWGPLLIGAVLSFLNFLVVPQFLLNGHAIRAGRAAARGDERLPDYDDWGELLINGLLQLIATLPYVVVAVTVAFAIVVAIGAAGDSAAGGAIALLALPVFLLLGYVGGAIVPTLLATGSVSDTYADARFLRVAFGREYLVGFFVLVAVQLVAFVAIAFGFLLLAITIIGIPVAFVGLFVASAYMIYLQWTFWGYVCWNADDDAVLGPLDSAESLDLEF